MYQAKGAVAVEQREFGFLMEQVGRAREALGEALGALQDAVGAGIDVVRASELLAGAVRLLYDAQEAGLPDSAGIGAAMDHLRDVLAPLQDACLQHPHLEPAAGAVARVLAILYPVYKALPETAVSQVARDSVVPLPLTHRMEAPPVDDDRREAPRVSLEVDIGLHSESNFFAGFSMDISSGGLFVATYDAPAVGTRVNLNFKLPDGPVLSVDGTVVWVREYNATTPDVPPGVGVRFDGLTDEDARAIHQYMERRAPLFYDVE